MNCPNCKAETKNEELVYDSYNPVTGHVQEEFIIYTCTVCGWSSEEDGRL